MPVAPARALAVVACMDARLDLFTAFGLVLGDAHIVRNAGGLVTDDVLRSLAISQRALDTRSVAVVHHTHCGMSGFDDTAFRAELTGDAGVAPEWDVPGFDDVDAQVRRSVQLVRACAWLPHRDDVRGYVYAVESDELREVVGTT